MCLSTFQKRKEKSTLRCYSSGQYHMGIINKLFRSYSSIGYHMGIQKWITLGIINKLFRSWVSHEYQSYLQLFRYWVSHDGQHKVITYSGPTVLGITGEHKREKKNRRRRRRTEGRGRGRVLRSLEPCPICHNMLLAME